MISERGGLESGMDGGRRIRAMLESGLAQRVLLGACCAACVAVFSGCAVNPSTGRSQLIALPAAQLVHADLGYSISAAAQAMVPSPQCARPLAEMACPEPESIIRFAHQVRRAGLELEAQARIIAPELFGRIRGFDIRVENNIGAGSASSAGGRIAIDAGLAAINPTDDVVAFVVAREMGHVIARHGEEDSGAKMTFSALTAFIPGAVILRFAASVVGAGVLKASWAEGQRREADELALQLLDGTDRSARVVALNLHSGMIRKYLPAGEWGIYFAQSVDRVNVIALTVPNEADLVVAAAADVQNQIR
jgi:Zn-dependent protease with chaperone function